MARKPLPKAGYKGKPKTRNAQLQTQISPRRFCREESRCPHRLTSRLKQNRQGLWIADLRTPPGQECSNGSMLVVAVVL
jgi:hypothetical protein